MADNDIGARAQKVWVELLEFTSIADRDVISNIAHKKAEFAADYLCFPRAENVQSFYEYLWCQEVVNTYECFAREEQKINRHWNTNLKGRLFHPAYLLRPEMRSDDILKREIKEEFKQMYEERRRKGLIK